MASITVNHSGDSIDVGSSLQLNATLLNANGAVITGQSVNWTATDRNVVDVSSTGVVSGLLAGNAIVKASIGNLNGSSSIRVRVPAAALYAIDTIGKVLGPSDLGQVPGETTGTADVSAIELPDGRIRIYYGVVGSGGPGHVGSAISSDGTHFTVEAGLRDAVNATATEGFASPFIFALPIGGYRLFYNGCHSHCGVASATSTDGLTFIADAGTGVGEFTALDQPNCTAVVKLTDGRYRIYCSQQQTAAAVGNAGISAIYSATSSDLLNWTSEAGVRIGQGSPTITADARHPTAIVNSDGSISLIYYQHRSTNPQPREMIARSTDGLVFDTEVDLGSSGTEPAVMKRANGSMLLYYGAQTPITGSTISVARITKIVR